MEQTIPQEIRDRLAAAGVRPDEVRHAVRSDLDADGRYGSQWALATDTALHLVNAERVDSHALADLGEMQVQALVTGGLLMTRPGAAGTQGTSSATAVAEHGDAAAAPAPNAGGTEGAPSDPAAGGPGDPAAVPAATAPDGADLDRLLLRFTNSEAQRFETFARAVAALQKGELAQAVEAERERHCPRCGLRYPDQHRSVCPRCVDRRGLFLRVLGYLRPYRGWAALIAAAMIAAAGLRTVAPLLSGRVLFDDVLDPAGRYHGRLVELIAVLAAVHLLGVLAEVLHMRITARVSVSMIYDLKNEIFAALQRLSLGFFTRKQTGGLMVRVNHDSMNLNYFFIDGLPYFVVNMVQIAAIVAAMIALNWWLALLLLIPAPLVVLIIRRLVPRIWRLFGRQYRSLAVLNGMVEDSLSGVRVVKAFGKEQEEIERFGPVNDEVFRAHRRTQSTLATLFPSVAFLTQAGGLVVWAAGGWQVVTGNLTFGVLMSFVGFVALLYEPLRFMTKVVEWWSAAMNSAQRIFEILDTVPEVAERADPVPLPAMRGAVELRGVSFGYEPNKPVLHEIDLRVAAGETVGLVGRTGAGKSTLINLMTRLYDTGSGRVLIDGIDVRDLRTADLRRQVGIILQDPYLFAGSVADNIAYGRPGASRTEIVAAARAAFAHDFVTALPNGYDTVIGSRGHGLSGGERQRLSIARAVLLDPRILILDEATSSVDSATEEMIQHALERLVHGRTTIAIAHRLSTLRMADRLVVVEQGRLVEQGTHDELMQRGGVYCRLAGKQQDALAVIGIGVER